MQPTLYLMVGYPGAGKTTVARLIEQLTGAMHLWVDDERRKRFGSAVYSAEQNDELYRQLNQATDHLLAEGKSIIFDTNFNFYHDRQYLRQIADRHHARTIVLWVHTPKALAKHRATVRSEAQETRVFGNMSEDDFERIVGRLEPPRDDEKVLEIDGTTVNAQMIRRLLDLK